MTHLPKIIHLIDDISLGGVTKSLALFEHPALGRQYDFAIEQVDPDWAIAPRLNASVIVVHFSASWKTIPFLYSLASRNPDAKLVLVEHSYSREWEALKVPEKLRFRTMLKLAYRIFDHVVCVSVAQADWLEEAVDLRGPKRRVIYPWSDMSDLARLERPHFSLTEKIVIGAYGRFVDDKGFANLVSIINRMGDQSPVQLRLGGFGPDEEKLQQLAAGNSNISFYGQVDDVADFIGQCDIIAVPSKFEAYGLVATEARLAARPILVSSVGGLPEQCDAAGIAVDFDDAKVVIKLLERIHYLPLVNMSVAGREECLGVTEDRIECWMDLLGGLLVQSNQKKVA